MSLFREWEEETGQQVADGGGGMVVVVYVPVHGRWIGVMHPCGDTYDVDNAIFKQDALGTAGGTFDQIDGFDYAYAWTIDGSGHLVKPTAQEIAGSGIKVGGVNPRPGGKVGD